MDKYLEKHQQRTTTQDSETESSTSATSSDEAAGKTRRKYTQNVRSVWLKDKRLKNWIVQDGNYVRCKYCRCRLRPKLFGLLRHAKSSKHQATASVFESGTQSKIPFTPKIKDETCKAELANALYVAAHTSIRTIDHLTKLQQKVFQESAVANSMQLRRTKCSKLIKSVLYPYFKNALLADISKNKFSLIIDECTDISVKKCLGIVIRYYSLKNGSIVNTFLKLQEISDCTATGIVAAVEIVLREYKLKFKDMVGLGTDNASVMVGASNGVIARLKEHNADITLVPCVCHSIQIAVSTASKCLPSEIEFIVGETYNWFSKSASRQKHYENVFRAINDDNIPLKIMRACNTRWLSVEPAIKRIVGQWLELKCHFSIAAQVESCYKAKILHDMFNDINLAYLKFLKVILTQVQTVNKNFESNSADPTKLFSDLVLLISSLCNTIISPCEEFNPLTSEIEKFFAPVPCFHYSFEEYIKLKKKENVIDVNIEQILRNNCRQFLVKLICQLRQRLPKNIDILRKLDFLSVENSLRMVKPEVFEFFSDLKCRYSEDEIDIIEVQWKNLPLYSWEKVNNTLEFWSEVRQFQNSARDNPFRQLVNFVYRLLLLPLSNAEVERTFSIMNFVKNKHRNKMNFAMLNALLTVRYGLKNVQKCCHDFEITDDIVRLMRNGQNCNDEESLSDDGIDIDIDI